MSDDAILRLLTAQARLNEAIADIVTRHATEPFPCDRDLCPGYHPQLGCALNAVLCSARLP